MASGAPRWVGLAAPGGAGGLSSAVGAMLSQPVALARGEAEVLPAGAADANAEDDVEADAEADADAEAAMSLRPLAGLDAVCAAAIETASVGTSRPATRVLRAARRGSKLTCRTT